MLCTGVYVGRVMCLKTRAKSCITACNASFLQFSRSLNTAHVLHYICIIHCHSHWRANMAASIESILMEISPDLCVYADEFRSNHFGSEFELKTLKWSDFASFR